MPHSRNRRSTPRPARPHLAADDGSQGLELAMVLPLIVLLAMVLLAVGQVILGFAAVHQLAITAARTAAVAHDDDVHAVLADAGLSAVDIEPASGSRRPGDLVTVTVARPLDILVIGDRLDLTAQATFRTEDVP